MMKNKIKAIILAAGRGSRMGESTEALPKCLLRLYGKPLLEWQTEALRAAGIDPISIVTGYKQETLAFPGFKFFHNPRWQETHMVSSLCRASQWLERDTCVVSYSDIVYSADTVTRLLNAEGDIVISYDSQWLRLWRARFEDPLKDAETFRLDEQGRMLEIGGKTRNLEDIQGQYMGLLKFTPKGWADTRDYLSSLPEPEVDRLDMTSLLAHLLKQNITVRAVPIRHRRYEVDTGSDLKIYEAQISGRAGNLWE